MRLGPFEISQQIGEGGMAKVFAASHLDFQTPVAIKVVQTVMGEALVREAHAVATLNHANIVQLLDIGTLPNDCEIGDSGAPYYVMEYCERGSLKDKKTRPKNWTQLRALLRSLLSALGHAHASGIVHCDLKPSNVLFGPRPGPVLADFGIAFVRGKDYLSAGTPAYMAPEQHSGDDIGPWTDLFSLGVLAWRLTGCTPWRGQNLQALFSAKMATSRPDLRPIFEVPLGLPQWLNHLTAGEWSVRYQSAAAALAGLDELVGGQNEEPLPTEEVPRSEFTEQATEFHVGVFKKKAASKRVRAPLAPFIKDFHQGGRVRVEPTFAVSGTALVNVRRPRYIGRSYLRSQLWEALEEVRSTRKGKVIHLFGPSGVGRARCARWVNQTAGELVGARVAELRTFHDPLESLHDLIFQVLGLFQDDLSGIETRLSDWGLLNEQRKQRLRELQHTRDWLVALPLTERVLGWVAEQRPVVVVAVDVDEQLSHVWKALSRWLSAASTLGRSNKPVLWIGTTEEPVPGAFEVMPLTSSEMSNICRQWVRLPEATEKAVIRKSAGRPGVLRTILLEGLEGGEFHEPELPEVFSRLPASTRVMASVAARLGPVVSVVDLFEAVSELGYRAAPESLGLLIEYRVLEHAPPQVRFCSESMQSAALTASRDMDLVCARLLKSRERWIEAARCYGRADSHYECFDAYSRADLSPLSVAEHLQVFEELEYLIVGLNDDVLWVDRAYQFCIVGKLRVLKLTDVRAWLVNQLQAMHRVGAMGAITLATSLLAGEEPFSWKYSMELVHKASRVPGSEVAVAIALRRHAAFQPRLLPDQRLRLLHRAHEFAVLAKEHYPGVYVDILAHLVSKTLAKSSLAELREALANLKGAACRITVGNALYAAGEHEEAIRTYHQVLQRLIQRGRPLQGVLVNLSYALYGVGRLDDAHQMALNAEQCEAEWPELAAGVQVVLIAVEVRLGLEKQAFHRVKRLDCAALNSPNGIELVVELLLAALADVRMPMLKEALVRVLSNVQDV